MIIMIMTFGCDFRYAHMQIVDMRRLGRSFATFLQRDLGEDVDFVKKLKKTVNNPSRIALSPRALKTYRNCAVSFLIVNLLIQMHVQAASRIVRVRVRKALLVVGAYALHVTGQGKPHES